MSLILKFLQHRAPKFCSSDIRWRESSTYSDVVDALPFDGTYAHVYSEPSERRSSGDQTTTVHR